MAQATNLILLTGIGADSRLLDRQRSLPYPVTTPEWIEPEDGESLGHYAKRFAATIDWPERFIVGGVSFGAMVARELAVITAPPPVGLLLIATRLEQGSPRAINRFVRGLAKAKPENGKQRTEDSDRMFSNMFSQLSEDDQRLMRDMIDKLPRRRLECFAEMVVSWKGPPEAPCPTCRIHGDMDLVVPIEQIGPVDLAVKGAGHLINMTHASEVNSEIQRFVESLNGARR